MIIIKHLQMNQISTSDDPLGVDIPLKNWTSQTFFSCQ